MQEMLSTRVRFGPFELDLKSGELRKGSRTLLLQEQPLRVLQMIVERGGELATRQEIQKKLWPNDTVVDFDHGINTAINKIRQALGDSADNPKYIQTVARRGYRLLVPVEWVGAVSHDQSDQEETDDRSAKATPSTGGLTGKKVSHYRVLEILGGGGMGVVYKAEDLKLGRTVALKFLPEELGDDQKAKERFEREARAASALDHPNLCSIYEFGEYEGQPFIVMQFLAGQNLRDLLANSRNDQKYPFRADELIDLAIQIAAGLRAAHEKGIIHRDIKPANIFITNRGQAKVLDFGVAKMLDVGESIESADANSSASGGPHGEPPASWSVHLTRTGAVLGTEGYMSPEQIRAERLDARTDLFSFGLVLYEMATGQRAFNGDTAAELHKAILQQAPLPPLELNPAIPPDLEAIICRCLEKERDRRYQFTGELVGALERLRQAAPSGHGRTNQPANDGSGTDAVGSPAQGSEESAGKPEETHGVGSSGANGRPKESTNGKDTLIQAASGNSHKTDGATDLNPNGLVKEATNGHQNLGSVDPGPIWSMIAKVGTIRPTAASERPWLISTAILVVLGAIGLGISEYRSRSALHPNDPAPLYVSEFTNSVGDTSFDYVLRDIVANELNRSPAVQVVASSEIDLADLLQKAGRQPPGDSLTTDLARQLCERAKGRFFTEGKIEPEGAGYGLELSVRECRSGRTVVQQRAAARNRDEVMQVASHLAATVRRQLSGESADSSENTPAPLPTASLEAYKAYLLGMGIYQTQFEQSAAMLRRAIELDPNFAKAWVDLSIADYKLNDQKRDDDDLGHAFALREKLRDSDKATVEARYHWEVTGEIYRAIEDLQILEKLQPHEFRPRNLLALAYSDIGMYEKATVEFRRNRDFFPDRALANYNLAAALLAQGRYDEAETVLRQVPAAQVTGIGDHALRYQSAILRSDQATLEAERSWMEWNADDPMAISFLARIDLSEGRLEGARQRTQHAVHVSLQSGLSESAAHMLLNLAWGDALYGQRFAARQTLAEAMKLSDSRETKEGAVRVMVLNGQEREAGKLMDALLHEHPTDTFLNELDSPLVLAASQLASGQAADALRTLDRTKPFQFGRRDALLSNYLQATAYLRLRRPQDAILEFGEILEHRGLSCLNPMLIVSQLGLARALAMLGNTAKSRAAFETFLATWKDANSNVPILKEAKAEYLKLQ